MPLRRIAFTLPVLAALLCGCSNSKSSPAADDGKTDATPGATVESNVSTKPETADPDKETPKRHRGPVQLGGSDNATPKTDIGTSDNAAAKDDSPETIMAALKPLQILMGRWEWKTQKTYGGFAAFDESQWVWDLLTDRKHPALVMTTGKSPFFNKLRLTYDPKSQKYLLTTEHKDEGTRHFEGDFKEQPKDVAVDDDKKLQRTFQLVFTEVGGDDKGDQWQVTFNQQRNDRYLLEMERKRGQANFVRFDTVASQREGTSFALADDNYGERTCIVSGGLGTMTVSYMGKTYYVCCSGCQAAFKDEPQRWIDKALAAAKKAKE